MKVYNPPTDLHLSTTLAQYLAQIRKERGIFVLAIICKRRQHCWPVT